MILDEFNKVHEELLTFLLPYHRFLCEENIWPKNFDLTSPNCSLNLIRSIGENEQIFIDEPTKRSKVLLNLMFIHAITSFLYVFAFCSLQTAIRHVENVVVQNMRYICNQHNGQPLFDLLTKVHEKFENRLHPKLVHIKSILTNFFEKRRQLINRQNSIPEPKVRENTTCLSLTPHSLYCLDSIHSI